MITIKKELLNLGIVIDNEYLDLYCELIEKNCFTKKEKYKTQAHHIVPKYTKIKDNRTVNLSHTEHCLAHYYLYKCSANDKYSEANAKTLNYVLNTNWENENKVEIILPEEIKHIAWNKGKKMSVEQRKLLSKIHTGMKQSKETVEKRVSKLRGRKLSDEHKKVFVHNIKHTEESKEKNRLAHLGKKASEETKLKISLSNKGKPAHNKGIPMSEDAKLKAKETWKRKREMRLLYDNN